MSGYALTRTRKLPSWGYTLSIFVLLLAAVAVTVIVWPAWVMGVYMLSWPILMYRAGRQQMEEFRPDRIREG
ncbi:MAG: hypothetical protein SVW02_04240 [Candidatus Nanohaloarchaea archaeon]|nr:hypothetical protein [Candidatus Nanohaloarchaea archaeon]